MTARTRFVNTLSTSGGDGTTNATTGVNRAYASINEAEAGEVGALVDIQMLISCSGGVDTSASQFNVGWSADADSSLEIAAHPDDVNATGIFDAGNYHLSTTANFSTGIRFGTGILHAIVTNIQLQSSGTSSSCIYVRSNATIRGCIFRSFAASGTSKGINYAGSNPDVNIINNVFSEFAGAAIFGNTFQSAGAKIIYNNTAYNCGEGIVVGPGGAPTRIFNNLLTNSTTDYQFAGTVLTSGNNVTSDGTSPDAGFANKTIIYTDSANGDYSTADSDVVGLGADLSADAFFSFDDDVKGDLRPGGAWDIGAFQEPASGASIAADHDEVGDIASAAIEAVVSIAANQIEAGDDTAALIEAAPGASITAGQDEAGDTTSASIAVITSITANQIETGDTASASLSSVAGITANHSEAGDSASASIGPSFSIAANQLEAGDTTSASIAVITSITANHSETGDTASAAINTTDAVNITANQLEVGDTASASLATVVSVTVNQAEVGDATNAGIATIAGIAVNQLEDGDAATASISNIASISANQLEAGDTAQASVITDASVNITANQLEVGDITSASLANIASIAANQLEAGDTTNASIAAGARVAASGDVDILPSYKGQSGIIPAYLAKVSII